MSDYYRVKYSGVLNPTTSVDLGSQTNQFANVFIEQNLTVGNTTVDENTLSNPKIASIAYVGDNTAADIAGGEVIGIVGSGFKNGATVVIDGAAVGVVTVLSSTTINMVSPAKSAGTYNLYVINPDGGSAISVIGIQYSGVPSWTTAAGNLGTIFETENFSANLVAVGNDIPITYSITSGTLPTGLTLTEGNGRISGTAGEVFSSTTYNFTVKASDYQNQDVSRNFNIVVDPDVVTWSSPADGITITQYEQSTVTQALSATSLIGYSVSYSANSLPTGITISGANISGTLSATAVQSNSTSLITATAATSNKTATRTINFVVNPDVVTWSSPTAGQSYSYTEFNSVNISLSATSAAGRSITYSASGLPSGLSISGSSITGALTTSGTFNVTLTATAATTGRSATRSITFVVAAAPKDALFTTAGTYSWTAPAGVTSVCVVCVGAGASGGGGGGLGWKNNIAVTPGQSYTVVVGATNNSSGISGDGTESYFISAATVRGGGGIGHSYPGGTPGSGGTRTGDGGGNGGSGPASTASYAAGGGGAGGYSGNGGNGGVGSGGNGGAGASNSGAGGGGGSGRIHANWVSSGSGGGVGIYGRGNTGTGGAVNASTSVASGQSGTSGSTNVGDGVAYGSGGGYWYNGALAGGNGAVRIVWRAGASFPTTNVGL